MSHWLELALIALLILVNGFLAMAELAVVSARRPRLQAMARRRGRSVQARGAQIALQLGENHGRFLSSVQTGITLVGLLSGAYSGPPHIGRGPCRGRG